VSGVYFRRFFKSIKNISASILCLYARFEVITEDLIIKELNFSLDLVFLVYYATAPYYKTKSVLFIDFYFLIPLFIIDLQKIGLIFWGNSRKVSVS